MRLDEFGARQRPAQQIVGIGGQERALHADPLQRQAGLGEVVGGELRRIEAAARGRHAGRPELAEIPLVGLHGMADVGAEVGAPFDIDQDRQIAADPDRVKVIEKEEPVAAEQILDVVFGRDQHRVDARLVEQRVETIVVEWQRRSLARSFERRAVSLVHRSPP